MILIFFLIILFILIALIIRLFFSPRKKLILITIGIIIAGTILWTWGVINLAGIGAQVSGGGYHQREIWNPFPMLILGAVLFVISIPCALVGLFKK